MDRIHQGSNHGKLSIGHRVGLGDSVYADVRIVRGEDENGGQALDWINLIRSR